MRVNNAIEPQIQTTRFPALTTRIATRMLWIGAFAIATAAAAQVRIDVPGTLVPITLQTAIVLLAGLKLGSRDGALSQAVYIAAGALGLPFFAGPAGLAVLLGPTGGYLIGFVAAAWTAGFLNRILERTFFGPRVLSAWIAAFLASIVLFVPGVVYLRAFVPSWSAAIAMGVLPFILGDLVKVSFAAVSYSLATKRR